MLKRNGGDYILMKEALVQLYKWFVVLHFAEYAHLVERKHETAFDQLMQNHVVQILYAASNVIALCVLQKF